MSETEHTFDRVVQYDERSKMYPIRPLLETGPYRSYSWRYVQLNQSEQGSCVGFAATMEAAARPKPVFGDPVRKEFSAQETEDLNAVAHRIYEEAQAHDKWPGEDYVGSSVLGAAKAGVDHGWWTEYRWALGPGAELAADDVMRAVGRFGPVMMGTWWYGGMMDPDADGYLRMTGPKLGGHSYLFTRFNGKRDAVWTPNSWGGEGQGWVTRADLTALMADEGEGCIPVVRAIPKTETA